MQGRFVVDMNGAKALNGETLRGNASYGKVEDAVRVAAATGAKVILPREMDNNVAESLMRAYGLQKVSHRTYTFCV